MSDDMKLSLERFEDLTALWGADTSRWPDDERPGAERLLANSAAARAARDRMAALDDAFVAYEAAAPAPSDALIGRILADAAEVGAAAEGRRRPAQAASAGRTSLLDRLFASWRPAAVCAASAALGVWLGYLAPADYADAAVALVGAEAASEIASMELDEGFAMAADDQLLDLEGF